MVSGWAVTEADLRARMSAASVLETPANAIRARLLASRPGREVFVLEAGGGRVIAKCYPDRPRAQTGGERLASFGGGHGPLVVPRCLKIDPELRVVVMTVVPGIPLTAALDGPGAASAIARVGRAVAALHALPVTLPTALDRAEELDRASRAPVARADRAQVHAALDKAATLLGAAPSMGLVPSHGDLGPAQILCADRVGIVDFDKAVMAEAALDLGTLLAQLARKRGATGRRLFDRFLDMYDVAARRARLAESAAAADRELTQSVVRGYALLVLVRKLAWLPSEDQQPVRAAIDSLVISPADLPGRRFGVTHPLQATPPRGAD